MAVVLMVDPLTGAVAVGGAVGVGHYIAHTVAGDKEAFEEAGVMAAGVTASLVAAAATYVILSGGVA
jgi:hypothetical protein